MAGGGAEDGAATGSFDVTDVGLSNVAIQTTGSGAGAGSFDTVIPAPGPLFVSGVNGPDYTGSLAFGIALNSPFPQTSILSATPGDKTVTITLSPATPFTPDKTLIEGFTFLCATPDCTGPQTIITETKVSFSAPPPAIVPPAIANYQYSLDGGRSYTSVAPPSPTGPVTISGLTNGITHSITLRALDAAGEEVGEPSDAVDVTLAVSAPDTPAAPTADAGDSDASVTWIKPAANGSAITGYTLTSAPDGKNCSTLLPSYSNHRSVTCVVTGLTNGTAYTFTVTATNGVGTSAASPASSSVTPEPPVPPVPPLPTVATPVPTSPLWLLGMMAGLLSLVGFRKLRKA